MKIYFLTSSIVLVLKKEKKDRESTIHLSIPHESVKGYILLDDNKQFIGFRITNNSKKFGGNFLNEEFSIVDWKLPKRLSKNIFANKLDNSFDIIFQKNCTIKSKMRASFVVDICENILESMEIKLESNKCKESWSFPEYPKSYFKARVQKARRFKKLCDNIQEVLMKHDFIK